MMLKPFSIAYYEARMSLRGWRFWLLLALIAGVSWFARGDYLDAVAGGQFLHSAYSFQHPSFWLMLSVILLGIVALSLDTCGRLRSNGMDKIMFPLPFSAMQLIWGRFIGVMLILIPLSALGFFSLALWQFLYGHGAVVWQPFFVAYFILILPIMFPVVSIAITTRTFFKHDFAALLFGAVLILGLMWVGQSTGLLLDAPKIIGSLQNSSPTIGVRIDWRQYLDAFGIHALITLGILYLAPLYLRRQIRQPWGAKGKPTSRIFGVSNLMQAASRLRFDTNLERSYRISLLALIVICASAGIRAGLDYQESLARAEERKIFEELNLSEDIGPQGVDVKRYAISVTPDTHDRLRLAANVAMDIANVTDSITFELDRRFKVEHVLIDGKKTGFYQRLNRLVVVLPMREAGDRDVDFSISYVWNEPAITTSFARMPGQWFPMPWNKIRTTGDRWQVAETDLFDAEITLNLANGQEGVFAGDRVSVVDEGARHTEQWKTLYPVDKLELYWGYFQHVEEERQGYTIRFFHLPEHEYQALVYLEEMKEQEQFVVEKLGRFPFPVLTIVEIPYEDDMFAFNWGWQERKDVDAMYGNMPGLIAVPEYLLSYMHEGIWAMERLDHDPRTIAYYQLLRPTVRYLHDKFYNNFISTYFDDALHPVGELAFWLEEYLSSYSSKLLERNVWKRKYELRYEIGNTRATPLRVVERDNLLTLHMQGQYRELERLRGEGLIRILHHLMGDEQWWDFLERLFADYRFRDLPVDEFLARAEKAYGDDLDWYVKDWLNGTALPEYEITYAVGSVIQDEAKDDAFNVYYNVEVRVKNHGTGRMAVPVFVETELDYIFRDLWLDTGEEKTLSITVPHRPVFTSIDPEHWVVQVPHYDEEKRKRLRSEKKISLTGDDRSQAVRQRRRDSGRRGWW